MEEVLGPSALLVVLIAVPQLPACSAPQPPADLNSQAPVSALLEGGHYRRALATLEANPLAKDATPGDIARRAYLESRVQLGLGHLDAALELAEQASTAEPGDASFHVQMAAVSGRIAQHASMFKQLTFAKRAKKELDDAVAIDPKLPDAVYGMMMFAEYAPSIIGGDKVKAQAFAESLTALEPARGYLAQATLARERKDSVAEGDLLLKATVANPKSYEAHIALANFMRSADPPQPDVVDEQACLALLIDPDRSDAWQVLAEMAVSAECWLEVSGLIQTAERFNPDDLSTAYSAAAAMITAGKNLDAAQSLLTRYLERPPEGAEPSHGRAHYELALLSEKRGNKQEAVFHLRAAMEEDPTMDDARKDLKRMEHSTQ